MIESDLPAPQMRIEAPVASEVDRRRRVNDLLVTLRPRIQRHRIPTNQVSDLDTLAKRLEAELDEVNSYAPMVGLVGA